MKGLALSLLLTLGWLHVRLKLLRWCTGALVQVHVQAGYAKILMNVLALFFASVRSLTPASATLNGGFLFAL